MKRSVDLREMAGMALCAMLSFAAFLALVILVEGGGRLPAILALIITLACPVVWLIVLLSSDGGGGGLMKRVKHTKILNWRRPAPRRKGQPTGVQNLASRLSTR